MQEFFNKDLEETNSKNSTIKNTLEGINTRITDAEEQISKLEDRMVEITAEEQNKEIRNKIEDVSEISGKILNTSTFELQGSQKKKRKRKGLKQF